MVPRIAESRRYTSTMASKIAISQFGDLWSQNLRDDVKLRSNCRQNTARWFAKLSLVYHRGTEHIGSSFFPSGKLCWVLEVRVARHNLGEKCPTAHLADPHRNSVNRRSHFFWTSSDRTTGVREVKSMATRTWPAKYSRGQITESQGK